MVFDGLSVQFIRKYLDRWVMWWVNSTRIWNYEELIKWFCDACYDINLAADACYDINLAAYAAGLYLKRIRKSPNPIAYDLHGVGLTAAVIPA